MMFADDDFNIDADFARTPENFDHASGRRDAAPRIARDLHVYHRAIEFRQTHAFRRARLASVLLKLLLQFRRQLLAGRNDDFMREARFVGQDGIAMRAVAKEPHNRRMRARDDPHDAPFDAPVGMAAAEARQHAVAVHRVAHAVRIDEQVAFHASYGAIGDHEAIAVAMRHEAAGNQIRILRRGPRHCSGVPFRPSRS